MTGYAACLQLLLHEPVAGVLYDGLMKKLPQAPKVLQDGGFSIEWNNNVTYASFLAALKDKYDRPDPETLRRYAGHLARLKQRDAEEQTPFFTRQKVRLTQHQIRQWLSDTWKVLEEI